MSSHSSTASRQGGSLRILLVDDHPAIRFVLKRRLSAVRDFSVEIVGEATDGKHAVHLAEQLRPDVLIMDVNMPVMNGIEATRVIAHSFRAITIFGWTSADDDATRDAMLQAGATRVFVKNGTFDDLIAAIRDLADDVEPEPFPEAA